MLPIIGGDRTAKPSVARASHSCVFSTRSVVIENRSKASATTTAIALLTRYGAGAQERATAETNRAVHGGDATGYLFWRQVVEDIADLRTKQECQQYALQRALRKHERP
jgi:hypothetical protein